MEIDKDNLKNNKNNNNYRIYKIKTKSKIRQIEEPLPNLKSLQKKLVLLFESFQLHNMSMAKKGSNIKQNALIHKDSEYIYKLDIKDCYKNTTKEIILRSLRDSEICNKEEIKEALEYCLFYDRGRYILPTGAPTSSILCNIALTPIDNDIVNLVNEFGYKYSRYVDDIHISSNEKLDMRIILKIKDIIIKSGYKINYRKTGFLPKQKTIITGVRLKQTYMIPRPMARNIRARLNNIAKDEAKIDPVTNGYLAHIQSIDKEFYERIMKYFETRKLFFKSLKKEDV